MNNGHSEISRRVEDLVPDIRPLYSDELVPTVVEASTQVVESMHVNGEIHHQVIDPNGNEVFFVPKKQPDVQPVNDTSFSFTHGGTRLTVEHAGEFDSSSEGILLGALEGAAQAIRCQKTSDNKNKRKTFGISNDEHTQETGKRISVLGAKLVGEAALVWLLFSGGFVGVHTAKELALDAAGASVEKVGAGWLADKISGGTDPYALNLDMKHNVKLLLTAPVQFVEKAINAIGDRE